MVNREDLVECIYFDGHEWSCPTSGENCELVDCRECASNLLAEYEQKIRAEAIDECLQIIQYHMNSYDGIYWAIKEIEELKEQTK